MNPADAKALAFQVGGKKGCDVDFVVENGKVGGEAHRDMVVGSPGRRNGAVPATRPTGVDDEVSVCSV
jgi:hypothetical protein